MFKILLKKQLTEVFRGWFVNQKTNKARSKASTVGIIVLFAVLMLGVIGGMFVIMAVSLCEGLTQAGAVWLYFVIFGLISIVLGLFGSVFNTYSGLYLAKDNDMLLSMPIPVKYIISSRIFNVYIMGVMYSAIVFVPSIAVYQIVNGFDLAVLAGSIIMLFEISLLVLVLSCLLGWAVAKVSVRFKNKSFVKVAISLLFVGVYYFAYFKAQEVITDVIANAGIYAGKIKQYASVLYYWGRNGEGAWLEIALTLSVCAAVAAATWILLSRSFLKLATSTSTEGKTVYREKAAKVRSVSAALLAKEFKRFTSSANYMLNCGFGVLFITIGGVVILITGGGIIGGLREQFPDLLPAVPVFAACISFMLASMNDMAAPSVSLEGKTMWVLQSLPIDCWLIVRAKFLAQLLITAIPMAFFSICLSIVLLIEGIGVPYVILTAATSMLTTVLFAFFNTFIGVKMPNLNWTNEIVPIKQSAATAFAIFGSWLYTVAVAGIYIALMRFVNTAVYLAAVSLVSVVLSVIMYRWLKTKGSASLATL